MNRTILYIILLTNCLISCNKQSLFFLSNHTQDQVIGLQPIDGFYLTQMDSLIYEISTFYHKRVILLKPINIPANFIHQETQKYSADSIILLLSKLKNDSLVEIIGLTNKPIFTIKYLKAKYYDDEKIFGMGYQPGNACIVSGNRLETNNPKIFYDRLKNVLFHEVGHNLGLSHCDNINCIMSGENGYFDNLDIRGKEYCKKCKQKLKL